MRQHVRMQNVRHRQAKGFILLGFVTEQLGKAAAHMIDAFELCSRYNRTYVLRLFHNGQLSLHGHSMFEAFPG